MPRTSKHLLTPFAVLTVSLICVAELSGQQLRFRNDVSGQESPQVNSTSEWLDQQLQQQPLALNPARVDLAQFSELAPEVPDATSEADLPSPHAVTTDGNANSNFAEELSPNSDGTNGNEVFAPYQMMDKPPANRPQGIT